MVRSGKTVEGVKYVEMELLNGTVRRDMLDGPHSHQPKKAEQRTQR